MKKILLLVTLSLFSFSCEGKAADTVDDSKKAVEEVAKKADELKKEKELTTKIEAIDKALVDDETELQKESDDLETTLTELDGI